MKIAIVSGDDVASDDPQQLGSALAARGHEAICSVRRRGRRFASASTVGCRNVAIPAGPSTVESPADVLPYVGDWAVALERAWSAEQPDAVHAYGWLGGLAAQLAARRQQIPTVQTFLGLAATSRPRAGRGPPGGSERARIEPILARSATWATGESTADVDALARLRRSRTRVSALTCGVDVDRYSPFGAAAARTELRRVLCLASSPLPANGFDIAIGALPRIPGAELVLAETDTARPGHDEARARLRRLAAELGVADRVRFAGAVADPDLPMLLRSADAVACTPRQPPRATSALQAMASGRVVVAMSVGVLNDAVIDNVTGLVLSPENPGALAAALRNLLAQSFQCESMGAAGRSRAMSRFAWDRIALDSFGIYQQVAA